MEPKGTSLNRTNTMDETIEDGLAFIKTFDRLQKRISPVRKTIPLSPPSSPKKKTTKKSKSPKRTKDLKAKKTTTRKSTSPIKRTTSPRTPKSTTTSLSPVKKTTTPTIVSPIMLTADIQKEIDNFKKERRMKSTGIDKRLTEIVFSFDTTGSMGAAINEAKKNITDITNRLFDTISVDNLKVGMIAHGDYCDPKHAIFQYCELSNDKTKIIDWIGKVQNGGGGDFNENYEQVIEFASKNINWTEGSHRVLVVIGDANPHDPKECLSQMTTYSIENPRAIDWKEEIDNCWEKGIKVYSVQAHNNTQCNYFYQSIAARTCGTYLKLDNFPMVTDMLLMVCFREADRAAFDNFRDEVEREGRMDEERQNMFDRVATEDKMEEAMEETKITTP